MNDHELLSVFVHKRINFRFFRQSLQLDLSQALFSSHDVDVGSRLLLKTIAKEVDFSAITSVLDVGCGVGVLGLAVQAAVPTASVVLQDRDALAVAFARRNAGLNGFKQLTVQGGLAFSELNGRRFDLIVSNLPGKVGEPVLRHLLEAMAAHLTDSGVAAIVIVQPLLPLVLATLQERGCQLVFQERGKGHTAVHFQRGEAVDQVFSPIPYRRGAHQFQVRQTPFTLETVLNVPEFDTLGYDTALALTALRRHPATGKVLIWNPNQGALPVYLQLSATRPLTRVDLASRDVLSLTISAHNLAQKGLATGQIASHHVPHIFALSEAYDFVIIFPNTDPGVSWPQLLLPHCTRLLRPGGSLLLTARSTFIHRLLQPGHPYLQKTFDRKKHGYRTILFDRTN